MKPTALIIDDSPVSRAIIRRGLLKADVHVAAEEPTGERALELYDSLRPTLVFLDITLPGIDGVTIGLAILAKHPEATVVFVALSLITRSSPPAAKPEWRNSCSSHFRFRK